MFFLFPTTKPNPTGISLLYLVAGLAFCPVFAKAAELTGTHFMCTVSPGYQAATMPITIRVDQTKLKVVLPTKPPVESLYELAENNEIWIIGVNTWSFKANDGNEYLGSESLVLSKRTGRVKIFDGGPDEFTISERNGVCFDIPKSR